jgi:hypothetical protein
MTCYGLTANINGHEYCFPIYEVAVHWPPPPNGDPLARIVRDLGILRTITEGAAHIADRHVRDSLTQAAQSAAKSLSLPDGVKLGDGLFKKTRELEHA